jgi:hypothetical protein
MMDTFVRWSLFGIRSRLSRIVRHAVATMPKMSTVSQQRCVKAAIVPTHLIARQSG